MSKGEYCFCLNTYVTSCSENSKCEHRKKELYKQGIGSTKNQSITNITRVENTGRPVEIEDDNSGGK